MKLVLHAPNIHQGGGASLLAALLQEPPAGMQLCASVDERFPTPVAGQVTIHRFASTLSGRMQAEWRLRALTQPGDTVLCFGNLPPLFSLRGTVVLFIQNRHLIDGVPSGFSRRMKLRLLAEQTWLKSRLANVQRVVVQTPTMQRLVRKHLGVGADVIPFHAAAVRLPGGTGSSRYDFIYVSSGEAHKNHAMLLKAWTLLAEEGIRPHLCLTLSEQRDARLCSRIAAASAEYGLRITNVGTVGFERVSELYASADALIFPSIGESFGLPLLEAAALQLPIIAPEADYVRDVVDPVQTFDPASALSIARALKRHLGVRDGRISPLSPKDFLWAIMRGPGLESDLACPAGSLQKPLMHTQRAP